ncbi:MAG: fibronectin type III domain-containing protein, partial [Elusimicrobia bacterium]|nr:fibronectin type III domain-containing protein [Elusimicrobiota bacterium]
MCCLSVRVNAQSDTTPPVSVLELGGARYHDGGKDFISVSSGYVKLISTDDLSGVSAVYYKIDPSTAILSAGLKPNTTALFNVYTDPFSLQEGSRTVAFGAMDNAGNYEQLKSSTIYADGAPPDTQASVLGLGLVDGTTAYMAAGDSITLTAFDPVSSGVASGVADIHYIMDPLPGGCTAQPTFTGPPGTCDNPRYSGPFSVGPGTHTILYTSIDHVGNKKPMDILYAGPPQAGSISGNILYDSTPPPTVKYIVAVSTDPHFQGIASSGVYTSSGAYTLPNLPALTTGYVMASLDVNKNKRVDFDSMEPMGGWQLPNTVYPETSASEPLFLHSKESADGIDVHIYDRGTFIGTVTVISAVSGPLIITAQSTPSASGYGAFRYEHRFNGEISSAAYRFYPAVTGNSYAIKACLDLDLDGNCGAGDISGEYANPVFPIAVSTIPDLNITIIGVPHAPAWLTGTAVSVSSISWTWQIIPEATGYAVYSVADGFISSATSAAYELSGLGTNSQNSVCVKAYNNVGASTATCSMPVYTLAAVPGVPEIVSVSSYSLTVKWSAEGNPAGTLYELNSSTTDNFQSGSSTSVIVGSGMGTNLPDLSAATTYYMRVRAINGDSIPSVYSASASTRTFAAPPGAPINPAAVFSAASKKVSLFWSAALSGTPAVSFRIYRAAEPDPGSFLSVGTVAETWFEDSIPLQYSSTYYYRVTALNSDGLESGFSQTVSTAADVIAPGNMTDLKVISTDSATGKITLSWTAPWEDWGLDRYIIKAATNVWSDAYWDKAQPLAEVAASTGSGGRETFVLTLASTDVVRYVALKAVDNFGNQSVMSNLAVADFEPPALDVTCAVPADSIVGRPFGVTIAAQDNYSLSRVQYLADGLTVSTGFPQTPSLNVYYTWDITDYSDGYHVFSVRVEDYSGNTKQWDLPVTVNYVPPAAPVITSPADGTHISTTTIFISGSAEPETYVVIFAGDVFMASLDAYSGSFETQITLSGDGTFPITAQAADKKGASPRSKPVSVIVDTGAPNPPRNLSAGSAAGGAVALLWSLPEGETPVSYNIYRSTAETGLSVMVDSASLRTALGITALKYTDYPPSDGIYYYGAASVDAAGNESGLSNISAAVSDRVPPSASVAVSSVPPLGAGSYGVTATVSETLAYAPYLTFTPYGQSPVQVYLTPESALVWHGTFTVTADMASGAGRFSFGGTDLSGNTGGPVTSGQTLDLETDGPTARLSLASAKPALKTGTYALNLSLNKPARETPALSYLTQSGSTETISLSSSTDAAAWTGAISIDTAAGEGTHNFSYRAYDRLGNKGELLSGTTYFIVDTIAPDKPLSLNGLPGAGGAVNLSWSAPAGEKPSAYCLYRDSQPVTCDIVPNPADFTGFYADTPSEGSYTYAVTALDAAGNESALSDAFNITSDSTPPAPAVITAYNALVELTWEPGPGEIPARYRLYRSTYVLTSAIGIPYRVIIGTSAQDSPESDGIYYYHVVALDSAGNESGLSNPAEIQYDGAAPVITISGVENNAYYNSSARPDINIMDLSLSVSTITLNASPFVSGSTVSAEGSYTLAVAASDISGHSLQKSLAFTIDKTSPALAVSGIQNNGYYEAAVVPVINVSDLNLSTVTAALNGLPFVSGSSVSAGGSYELAALARDKAGNVSTLSISFTVNPPPAKPKNLSVTIEDGKTAVLKWESPADGLLLYKVYKDGLYIGPAQTTDLSFRDTGYCASGLRVYEVSAIDSKGREGEKARAEIPQVSVELSGYGTIGSLPSSPSPLTGEGGGGGAEALNRGFFDFIRLKITNNGAQAVSAGPLAVYLAGNISGEAPAVDIPAGSFAEVSAAVYISASLPASISARAVLTFPPDSPLFERGAGGDLNIVQNLMLNVRDPKEPIVEVYPEALVRGAYSNVRLKFNNRGSASLDVITARLSGSKQIPSKAVAVELKTQAGLLLSRAELTQTVGANIALVNGEQLYFVSIPGGGSFTFDPVR